MVRRHDRWVRGVAFGVLGRADDLDDVSQQVWTSVWRRIAEVRDVRNWRSWLYRLARNAALDAGRERSRRRARMAEAAAAAAEAESSAPDLAMMANERQREVLDAIAALPALYREPFVLRHLQGWSYRQIAEVMGMPVDSVETRLVRAMRRLRKTLIKTASISCEAP